jgi:hypothetical protein
MSADSTDVSPLPVDTSPHVNHDLLDALAALNAQLREYGLGTPSGYSLAPALGGEVGRTPPLAATKSANLAFESIRVSAPA